MMFTWEWNPAFGAASKPQQFSHGDHVWTHARGGMHTYGWIPAVVGVWTLANVLVSQPVGDKVLAGIGWLLISLGWWLSRRFNEKGWRVSEDNHLWVLTHAHGALDLGCVVDKRLVTAGDFESFKSKSFNSLRFPMLRFKSERATIGVIGSLPRVFSQGFQMPFTLGFFYTSVTWGSFELQSGADRSAWIETDQGQCLILVAYTPEALHEGLSLGLDANGS